MNIKAIIALGGIILAIIGWGELRHYQGKSEQRNIDLLSPRDTSAIIALPKVVKTLPSETILAPSRPTPASHRGDGLKPAYAPKTGTISWGCDSLQQIIDSLLIPREATVITSQGETIEVTYDPETENFTVIPTPLVIVAPQERYITRNLPEVPSPTRDFWIGVDAMSAGGPAVMGTLGYKTVGFKVGLISDRFAWGIALHLPL